MTVMEKRGANERVAVTDRGARRARQERSHASLSECPVKTLETIVTF